jgi:hypothetical protein
MKLITTLFAIFFTIHLLGQEVLIQNQNSNYFPKETNWVFDQINIAIDSNQTTYVASISVLKENQKLLEIFRAIWEKAANLGANSYRVTQVDSLAIEIDIYFVDSIFNSKNLNSYPKDEIIIFGKISNRLNIKGKKIKINKNKILLEANKYVKYKHIEKSEVTLGIGGFTGSKVWIQKEGESYYYTTSNLEVFPALGFGFNGGIGVGINISTGMFYNIDQNFGLFLKEILVEQKVEII